MFRVYARDVSCLVIQIRERDTFYGLRSGSKQCLAKYLSPRNEDLDDDSRGRLRCVP